MLKQGKKELEDELTALSAEAERAARDLHALAADITLALDTLPRFTSSATRELMEQHARRAKAIAAALQNEVRQPEAETARLLLRSKRAVGAAVMVTIAGLGAGVAEAAGDDVWNAVKAQAAEVLNSEVHSNEDEAEMQAAREKFAHWGKATSSGSGEYPLSDIRFAESPLKNARLQAGLYPAAFAEKLGIDEDLLRAIEAGVVHPAAQFTGQIFQVIHEMVGGGEAWSLRSALDSRVVPGDVDMHRADNPARDERLRLAPSPVRALRQEVGSTIEEFAIRVGIPPQRLLAIEDGHDLPTPTEIGAICEDAEVVFGETTAQLFSEILGSLNTG